MFPLNLLRAAFLASFLVPWALLVTVSSPIPVDSSTKYATTTSSHHSERVQSAHGTVRPGTVHLYPVDGSDGHRTGSVLVDRHHVKGMSTAQLHVHAEHVRRVLRESNPHQTYHVHAHHTPGDAHAKIHVVPHREIGLYPGHHAVRLAGPSHSGAPSAQKKAIHDALTAEFHPADGSPHNPLFNFHVQDPTNWSVHGQTTVGTMPIAHPSLQGGMTPAQLKHHADWLNDQLPHGQRDKTHIHLRHDEGDPHIRVHTTPLREGVTHEEIKSFLNNRTPHIESFTADPISRTRVNNPAPGQNQFTFMGTMPAHTRGEMTTDQADIYAHHAKDHLVQRHGLVGDDEEGMAMAAVHKAGQKEVAYHTQPKTEKLMKRLNKADVGYAPVTNTLTAQGHTAKMYTGEVVPVRHAEHAALELSARIAKVPHTASGRAFVEHVNGHVIGVAGQGDRPCNGCHESFIAMGAQVAYTDMDGANRGYEA